MPTEPFVSDCNDPEKLARELREAFNAAIKQFFEDFAVPDKRAENYLYGLMMTHFKGQVSPSVVKNYIAKHLVVPGQVKATQTQLRSARVFELSLVAREAIYSSQHYRYGHDVAVALKAASEAITDGKSGEAVDFLSQAVTDLISSYRNKTNKR